MKKNYMETKKKEYPKVEALSHDVFGYIDLLEINGNAIYIMFLCNKVGKPIGTIENTYFNEKEKISVTSPSWLEDYKRELLHRILEDLETKKAQVR